MTDEKLTGDALIDAWEKATYNLCLWNKIVLGVFIQHTDISMKMDTTLIEMDYEIILAMV